MKISIQLHCHPDSQSGASALCICTHLSVNHQILNIYLADEGVNLLNHPLALTSWKQLAESANIDIFACSSSCNRFQLDHAQLESADIQIAGQIALMQVVDKSDQHLVFNN